jgi:hypothetical protein
MKPEAEGTEWVEEEEEEIDSSGLPMSWRGDYWFNFYWIAEIIQEREGVSRGVAERTLRELCATGDVRSIRCDAIAEEPEEPEIIKPSEWVKDQVDLTDTDVSIWICVSCGDVQYWLDKQALAAGRPIEKFWRQRRLQEFLAEFEQKQATAEQEQAASTEPTSQPTEPTLVKARASRKQGLARTAIKHLWPEGLPEALTNPQIDKQVDDWITGYCKKNNVPKPDIGRDTILRAAGRRQ